MGGGMMSMRMRLVSSVSFVVSYVSQFASVFTVFLPTLDFLHMLSFSSVQGGGMGLGVMTSMRMRLVSSVTSQTLPVCRFLLHHF